MELERIIDSLDDDEREKYFSLDTNGYYDYLKEQDEYKDIIIKMRDNSLSIENWNYIISRLYLVLCKSISEEKEFSSFEKFTYNFSNFCITHFDENLSLYKECFKIKKYIEGYERLKSLNIDLADGLAILIEDKSVDNLGVLLELNERVYLFRDYNNSFAEEYYDDKSPHVSKSEYYNINMSERNYYDAKKLMIMYNSNNNCCNN